MNTNRKILLCVLLMLLFTLASGTALASNKTPYSGSECSLGTVNPGEWVQKGGKMHVIGMQEAFEDIATDPRISGYTLVIVNAILDPATFSGPMWGTFELVNADGAWTGQWVGNLDNFASSLQATAHGSGAYEGLVANVHYNRPGPWACFVVDGYIIETGK